MENILKESEKVKALRGAVSVEEDHPDLIREAVRRLLTEMKKENDLSWDQTISLLFSVTSDLRELNPATAARELFPLEEGALFTAQEAEVKGMLPRMIRVLITAYFPEKKKPRFVYLGEARKLRPDLP